MRYQVIINQDENKMFIAQVPALPGCISEGHTKEAVLENIREAIVAYRESFKTHDEPIPPFNSIS